MRIGAASVLTPLHPTNTNCQGWILLLFLYMPDTSLILFHLLHGRYLRVQVAVLLKESDRTSPWTLWIIEANSHFYKNSIYINEQPPTIRPQHEGCGTSIILDVSPKLPFVPISWFVNRGWIQGDPTLFLKSYSDQHRFSLINVTKSSILTRTTQLKTFIKNILGFFNTQKSDIYSHSRHLKSVKTVRKM